MPNIDEVLQDKSDYESPYFNIKDLTFQQYVKPGIHYFFLMVNGKCFINQQGSQINDQRNQPFNKLEYPGTGIELNTIQIIERNEDF